MIVVDTSAALAVLLQEDDAREFAAAIEAVETALISVASVIEAGIVLRHRGAPGLARTWTTSSSMAACTSSR